MNNLRNLQSVADVGEHEIVSWLFGDNPSRSRLLDELGLDANTVLYLRVSQQKLLLRDGPGDVDVLAIPQANPSQSTAIECKRIKSPAPVVAEQAGEPNKLHQLKKAVIQANLLARAGFHRVILLLVVEVDAQTQQAANLLVKGLSGRQAKRVRSASSLSALHWEVGLVCVEIVQPSPRSYRTTGGMGVEVVKAVTARTQPETLTAQLTALASAEQGFIAETFFVISLPPSSLGLRVIFQ